MVGIACVFETRGLSYICNLFQGTIKKCTFHIHLIKLEVMERCISKQETNSFKTSNGRKGVLIVNTFYLGIPLRHKPCFVSCDYPVLILLVLEHPLGPNDIDAMIFRPLH